MSMLDFVFILEHYRSIAVDVSDQNELEDTDATQQINFIASIDCHGGATMFFIVKKQNQQ